MKKCDKSSLSLFQKRTKFFSSWVNYVRLHLHIQFAKKVKRLLWLCGYWVPKTYFSQRNQVAITLSQLAKDVSVVPSLKFILHVHRQANCCSETFFWIFFERVLFTLRYLQLFVVAFIEQVQNIEKSKASVVEVVSCFATVKARIQERQSDVGYISRQIKSALRKVSEGKDYDFDLLMSDVSVLHKSCVSHLAMDHFICWI